MESYEGTLEIDNKRGIIYFHLSKEDDIIKLNNCTLLRICNLPRIPKTPAREFLDITHMHGVSWYFEQQQG